MKPYARADRISIKLKEALSELLHKKVNDPRLEMTIISGVKITQDLRDAYIYFAVSGGDKAKQDAIDGFNSASGFLRSALAKKLKLRYMPKLRFLYDNSFDYGSHIDSILKSLDP